MNCNIINISNKTHFWAIIVIHKHDCHLTSARHTLDWLEQMCPKGPRNI
jgi:hypothetical protein